MKRVLTSALGFAVAVGLAGCAGGSDKALPEGSYRSDVTVAYLTQHGLPTEHAKRDHGIHQLTLATGSFIDSWMPTEHAKRDDGIHQLKLARGSFTDSWTNSLGEAKFCTGTYRAADERVTFTWISGCFGDWSARYSVGGDEITWSDMKALPPNDTAEDQRQVEIFNAVPWTRTGDAR